MGGGAVFDRCRDGEPGVEGEEGKGVLLIDTGEDKCGIESTAEGGSGRDAMVRRYGDPLCG